MQLSHIEQIAFFSAQNIMGEFSDKDFRAEINCNGVRILYHLLMVALTHTLQSSALYKEKEETRSEEG